ncbi:MAG: hypothetical protein LQ337_000625 [Flavoplaca oasis]|nr:MAG: hypothetical protein LQ337_000625 [Flavoplaca oasis]
MVPSAKDWIDWGFPSVLELNDSLSSPPTLQTYGDCSPTPSSDKFSSLTSSPLNAHTKSDLGNFDRVWIFLNQPLNVPPPDVPPPSANDPSDNAYETTEFYSPIGKEVHWRDETDGAGLADNEDAGNSVSLLGLTKTQRKKLRRKQRRASERQLSPEIPTTSSTETESDAEPRTPNRSPDRRAIIQQLLQGPPKTPQNGTSIRPTLPIDIGAWPIANPHPSSALTKLRTTGERAELAAAAAKKERLIRKIKERFLEDRQFLTNAAMVPFSAADNSGTREGIHVFVDASNIMIGFHDSLKISRGLGLHTRIRRQPISFHNLSLILERGRPVSKRVLVGSDNFAAIQEAKLIGYETNILDRVHKAKELTPRQKKYQSSRGQNANASSGANGTSGGSGSETNAAAAVLYAKEKWVEQAVDEILHLKILESVVDAKQPSTMVLATGDAAEAEYSQGFLRMVERALEKGWKVELVSFRKNTSGMYKRKEFRTKWKNKFKTVELDDFVEELLGFEE